MAIKPLLPTECYRCEVEILATMDAVHPLCANCEADFDDWFSKQLIQLDERNN